MSRNIRLFPTYSQQENQTTNHCLLILKMIYEENPKFLSDALSWLLDDSFSSAVGVQFAQQKHGKEGVPDGEITQEPFSILIETKLGSNFDKWELLRHLETLKEKQGQRVLLALGNFEQDIPSHPDFPEIEREAKKHGVNFAAISFEHFFKAIQPEQLPYLSKNLVDAVSDLGEYFDENGLLPSWKYRLDVINCTMSFDNVLQNKVYTCPAQGGAFSHRRSLYFGAYKNKCVEQVARIEAVVDLVSESESEANSVVWKNNSQPEEELINTAIKCYQKTGDSSYPMRVFILGDFFPTYFSKTSSGGMFGSKKYFDIEKLKVADAEDLAAKLKGKTWENYESLAI
jgi:hypothetical protein